MRREQKFLEIATSGNNYNDQQRKVKKEIKQIKQLEQATNFKSIEELRSKRKTELIIKNIIQHKGHEVSKIQQEELAKLQNERDKYLVKLKAEK